MNRVLKRRDRCLKKFIGESYDDKYTKEGTIIQYSNKTNGTNISGEYPHDIKGTNILLMMIW